MVGHVDDLVQGQAPELHVQVDGPHHLAEGQRPGGGVVRGGAGQPKACAETADKDHCEIFHADDEAYFEGGVLDDADSRTAATTRGAVCKDYSEWVQAWTEIKG